ncbi:GspH/FimT family pseudopilin [Acinetobacter soli]|uniref:GspH/FimT family pseudopilin n=1 Tax=Acinetobacter soli TaxID=487316 RepID=UPI00125DE545|nr:GspH/FimT family pseudopilin [Acinetobacter soli]
MNNNFLGFSLIEFIVTLTVLSILIGVGLPTYQHVMATQEANHIPRTLTIHIQKAKSDAVLYRHNVVLCPSIDKQTCSDDWSKGFIVFLDQNRNRQRDINEDLLSSTDWNTRYGMLSWKGTLQSNHLMFRAASGLPIGSNGSFYYCSQKVSHKRLVISRMGHFRVETLADCPT